MERNQRVLILKESILTSSFTPEQEWDVAGYHAERLEEWEREAVEYLQLIRDEIQKGIKNDWIERTPDGHLKVAELYREAFEAVKATKKTD